MMKITEIRIPGCYEITPLVLRDERGAFVKTFHHKVFSGHGLTTDWREEYYSTSHHGVLRGLHFQLPPHDHDKMVYCLTGRVLDAVVDLRKGSPTYGRYALLELDAENANMLYIPRGLAHGFYVLSDSATMLYKVSSVHAPEHEAGILWSSVGIPWATGSPCLSQRDTLLPTFERFSSPFQYAGDKVWP